MIEIRLDGLDAVQRAMRTAADQVPFALARALNDTAFKVRAAEQSAIGSVFDRPTPWFTKQVRYKKATKTKLTAIVGSRPAIEGKSGVFDTIMMRHLAGDTRLPKPVERRLITAGLLPSGWVAVPSSTVSLNQYGNITRANWMKILDDVLGPQRTYFATRPGHPRARHLQLGIYRRMANNRLRAILLFKREAKYSRRMPWTQVAQRTVADNFAPAFEHRFREALESAR